MGSPESGATEPLQHGAYTVGWVCALPKEQTAATAMLEERHPSLAKPPKDPNTYTLGSIGGHNIVIACLPKGKIGTNSAATVATHMVSTFPAIRFGLMVGIGGAASRKIRLGDVVVSVPSGSLPGVVQWDMGKAEEGTKFKRTGSLNNPPGLLLTALTKLETDHELDGSKVPEYLEDMATRYPKLVSKYQRSDQLVDVLFKATYSHKRKADEMAQDEDDHEEEDCCRHCDLSQSITRKPRDMMIHYGLIASGNQVIKSAAIRDQLSKDLGDEVLCVEMEAAGLMDNFPCIVIRGICDYADSHKNKAWQEHAAAVAAAFAKELLGYVEPADVEEERAMKDILKGVSAIKDDITHTRVVLDSNKDIEVLKWLTPTEYGPQHSDYLRRRQPGTGEWMLKSPEYEQWLAKPSQTLFCPGIPGAGKTILASIVINDLELRWHEDASAVVAYIYINFKRKEEQAIDDVMLSLLKQLAQCRSSLPSTVIDLHHLHHRKGTKPTLPEISLALRSVAAELSRVFVVVDALDEYDTSRNSRHQLLSTLLELQEQTGLNLFATARPIPDIVTRFNNSLNLEVRASGHDIQQYIRNHLFHLERFVVGREDLKGEVISCITKSADGMFLLAQLHLESLKDEDTPKAVRSALAKMTTPSASTKSTYDRAYEDTMSRIAGQLNNRAKRAMQVLGWITAAKRQLTSVELQHALAVEYGSDHLDPENLPQIEHLVAVCAGLVTIDEQSDIIRLVHYTAQEYFESTKERWFPNIELEITTNICSYLSFAECAEQNWRLFARNPRYGVVSKCESCPFLSYAVDKWPDHARTVQTCDVVLQFLKKAHLVEKMSSAVVRFRPRGIPDSAHRYLVFRTGLNLAACVGFLEAVKAMLNHYDINIIDGYGHTALVHSMKAGYPEIAQLLIEYGADVNAILDMG